MQLNLFENIKIFMEIVDAGSFTQAAENLELHRPAVTKAVQQLETQCGVRLLQRTTRRIALTSEGEEFYRRSKPLLYQADELLASFAPDRPLHGQLRVDMPVAFARQLVVPRLAEFYAEHPALEIILTGTDVRRDMLREGLDCMLRVGKLDDGDYMARPMGEVRRMTCASPGYLAQHGTPQTLDDLRHHQAINWIVSNNREIVPWHFTTSQGVEERVLPGRLILDNAEVYISAGLSGLGLLQGMNFFLQPYIDSGQLVEVLPNFPCPSRKLSLIYPHRHLPQKVRVFAQWLESVLQAL